MTTEELRAEIKLRIDRCDDEVILLKIAKFLHEHIHNNPDYDEKTQRIFEKYDSLFRRLAQ